MLDAFEESPGPVDGGADAPRDEETPSPVLVIEYRRPGLVARLTPPALILLAALLISSYQRQTPLRPILPRIDVDALIRSAERGKAPVPPPEIVFRPKPAATPEPKPAPPAAIPTAGEPAPEPAPAPAVADATPRKPAASAIDDRAASFFELDPAQGLEPVAAVAALDPVAVAVPEAEVMPPGAEETGLAGVGLDVPAAGPPVVQAPPGVSRDDIFRDIEREAAETEARRAELEWIKPRARGMILAEEVEKVHEARVPFRQELRRLLVDLGRDAGPEIDRLCEQFGRDPLPEVRAAYKRLSRRLPTRTGLPEKIEFMRAIGLPEPSILDYIAHGIHRTINTRGGPRDEDDVRFRAARVLLSMPVPARPKTAAGPARGEYGAVRSALLPQAASASPPGGVSH